MVIDSKKYGGLCRCGKEHAMATRLCVIEKGALSRFDELLGGLDIKGKRCAVYDELAQRQSKAFGKSAFDDFERTGGRLAADRAYDNEGFACGDLQREAGARAGIAVAQARSWPWWRTCYLRPHRR